MIALPLWADIAVSLLVLAGALIALIGSFNLMRLRTFFERAMAKPSVVSKIALSRARAVSPSGWA